MKRLFLIPLIFISTLLLAQNEANVWYFGIYAGLDFNNGSPVALTDGELSTDEGCASICDKGGNILFYTRGDTIWGKDHQYFPNGTDLKGTFTTTQSALIIPQPNSSSIYYVFTLARNGYVDGFRYSVVDMNLRGGIRGCHSFKKEYSFRNSCYGKIGCNQTY